jgi:protein-disulfide isomerase
MMIKAAAAVVLMTLPLASLFNTTSAWSAGVDTNGILHDPDAPVGGNPQGDVTIVAFLDYNCPFCKKATPALDKLIQTDGHIRLVYKDWPILTDASVYGAKTALAARYQGKYEAVHAALMAIPGRQIPIFMMRDAVKASGVDMPRLEADAQTHAAEIDALLKRNLAQADSLGLQGTPVFLIGPFKVAAALDYEGFKKSVADARARNAQ